MPASGSPAATYSFSAKDLSLQVYAEGGGIPTSAVLTSGDVTYATPADEASGITADPKGRTAEVDAVAADVEGGETTIQATFDCTSKGGRKKR